MKNSGIYTYLKDAKYPLMGFPSSETIFFLNQTKALFIEPLKILAKWYFLPTLFLLYLNRQKVVEGFNRIAHKTLSPYILKYHYMSKLAQTLYQIVFVFLMEIGIKEPDADRFAEIFSHFIEYDGAYRIRVLDLFSETSKELMIKNPSIEINKIMKILDTRDSESVSSKFKKIALLLKLGLLIPKFKKAFIKAIKDIEFKNLQYAEDDMYWVCIRTDYNFMGKSLEERKEYAKSKGWTYPKQFNK